MNEKIYCTSCGAENDASARFCVSCGASLETSGQDQNTETCYSAPEETPKKGSYIGVAIASLVCGILSLLCCPLACCGSCCGSPNVLLALAAIVLGIVTLVKTFEGRGMAIAGIICGGIALVGMIFALILPASFTKGLMTGILGQEYNAGDFDNLEDLMKDLGVEYDFS